MYTHYLVTIIFLSYVPFKAHAADTILNLPGLVKQPGFYQYSGYLKTASDDRHLHYWFVNSQTKTFAKDPVILWLTGGPGCSSMLGLLKENGPFLIQDNGVNLAYNDYAWNKFANVLYLESPAGVGFSYSDSGNVTTDDDQVTEDHFAALNNFYAKFPAYQKNSLYIIGESYGGVYAPLLALKINQDSSTIPLKGLAVGNGLLNYSMTFNSAIEFGYYHGIIGEGLWTRLTESCCDRLGNCNYYNSADQDCQTNVSAAVSLLMNVGVNPYNVLEDCAGGIPPPGKPSKDGFFHYDPHLDAVFSQSKYTINQQKFYHTLPKQKVKSDILCFNNTPIQTYLSNTYVRMALHINANSAPWQVCSDAVSQSYKRIYEDMSPIFKQLLSTYEYRILVYHGDLDFVCSFLGGQTFVESLRAEEEVQWRPWLYQDLTTGGSEQIAGFVKEFDNLAFATIKGAGHLAPQDKPVASQLLIQNFIEGRPF